MYKFS